jgi:hypothetical protein
MKNKILQLLFCWLIILATACIKDKQTPLPDNSISIQGFSTKDTLVTPLPVKDSLFVMGFTAILSGVTSSIDHWVSFSVDSTKIGTYRTKYGNPDAILLPSQSYFFYKSICKIAANATLSDSVQINITKASILKGYSTYVLPVTIQSVDGKTTNAIGNQTIYLVFKTGKPTSISRFGWTATASTSNGTNLPAKAIDADDLTTYWLSATTATMPQWIMINFNSSLTFTGVTYYLPTVISYPTLGGYPTSFQIETSMDGTTWVNKGIFTGNIISNKQTLTIGLTTAKYLRFTSLACVKYSGYNIVFMSGIGLVP